MGRRVVRNGRIEVWIAGVAEEEKSCGEAYQAGQGACISQYRAVGSDWVTASADQTATASEPKYFHTQTAYANRFVIEDNGDWWPQGSVAATLNLGNTPQEDCEAQGNLWVDGICEFNPDGGNGSPIIIPVGKKLKYKLTSVGDGVRFDLDDDGLPERVAWTRRDSEFAFLAIDRNGDGRITNGAELFGDRTLPGSLNGFLALDRLMPQDPNGNPGVIEEGDPIFDLLLLWTDVNHNGLSEPGELQPAKDLLARIGVGYQKEPGNVDKYGNQFWYSGWAERRTGPGKNESQTAKEHRDRMIKIYDVFLAMVNVA